MNKLGYVLSKEAAKRFVERDTISRPLAKFYATANTNAEILYMGRFLNATLQRISDDSMIDG